MEWVGVEAYGAGCDAIASVLGGVECGKFMVLAFGWSIPCVWHMVIIAPKLGGRVSYGS